MKCFYHLESEAVGYCSGCGKPLCEECMSDRIGKTGMCQRCSDLGANGHRAFSVASGVLSICTPGLGQLIRGEYVKAAGLFVLFVYAMSIQAHAVGILIWVFASWDGFTLLLSEEDLGLNIGSARSTAGLIMILVGLILLPGPFKGLLRPTWLVPVALVAYGLFLLAARKKVAEGKVKPKAGTLSASGESNSEGAK